MDGFPRRRGAFPSERRTAKAGAAAGETLGIGNLRLPPASFQFRQKYSIMSQSDGFRDGNVTDRLKDFAAPRAGALSAGLARAWEAARTRGPAGFRFWLIALCLGVAAGFAAIGFRFGVSTLQTLFYGTDDPMLHSRLTMLPWWVVLTVPVLGGLAVGILTSRFTKDGRVLGVAEVIEGAAVRDGRVGRKAGLVSSVCSLITLSTGGSTGREGPVVHLASVISSWIADRMKADGITGRDLLGCAVAGAVSASFNAPIAGALFALEVVLRHFAVHAFAPIVIAAAAGTVINRLVYGDVTEYALGAGGALEFHAELPAFLILGLVCGLVAVAMMRAIFIAEDVGSHLRGRFGIPRALRPACAGLLLGLIALKFPHIIGVGYETTSAALTGSLSWHNAVVFAALKVAAVAITMGGRMGGGVFSPSLMTGALTGLAFGILATGIFPTVSGSETLYALAGMGAVAAAVLGAPISTTLIVFELTGDWRTGLAVMVAVSTSTALASKLVDRSFFLTQLERRGVKLAAGPQAYLLSTFTVDRVMRAKDDPRSAAEDACHELIGDGVHLDRDATLEAAMPMFERVGTAFIPVTARGGPDRPTELLGALFEVDALKAYNRALADTAAEEHG